MSIAACLEITRRWRDFVSGLLRVTCDVHHNFLMGGFLSGEIGHLPTLAQHNHPVRHVKDVLHVVAHEQDRNS